MVRCARVSSLFAETPCSELAYRPISASVIAGVVVICLAILAPVGEPRYAVYVSEELSLTKVRRFSSLTSGKGPDCVRFISRFWRDAVKTMTLVLLWLPLCSQALADAVRTELQPAQQCVILLHGLARTAASMKTLQSELKAHGYQVVNHDYASRKHSVQKLAETAVPEALSHCVGADVVHFVTHSMGGILVRAYLAQGELERMGRVVMLGPPNQGSEVVDHLANVPGFELINGPAGKQLGTAEDALPKSLGAVNFELGVIAGTRTLNPLLSQLLPNPDDGKVAVAATKVEGMTDFIALPVSHPLMMNSALVIEQVLAFLQNGRFQRHE